MFGVGSLPWKTTKRLAALDASKTTIKFAMDGNILAESGSSSVRCPLRTDIRSKNHGFFIKNHGNNASSRFCSDLRDRKAKIAEFQRMSKSGKEPSIQASYKPVIMDGKSFKVVKYDAVFTKRVLAAADGVGQVAAISNFRAVAYSGFDGCLLNANDNFLRALAYEMNGVLGQPRSMFVLPKKQQPTGYKVLGNDLRNESCRRLSFAGPARTPNHKILDERSLLDYMNTSI